MLPLQAFRTPKKFESGFNRSNVLLFSILMLLQFVIISLFQAKLSIRNNDLNDPLNLIYDRCHNNNFKSAFSRNLFIYYVVENYLFISFQLFLLYLGLTALFDQYVLQICIYAVLNFGGYLYLIAQMIEIKSLTGYAKEDCLEQEITQGSEGLKTTINPKIVQNELPQFILYTIFVIITGFLSLYLFLQCGINNYFQRKVGNNELFISLLKRRQFFKLLLKTFTFFSIIYLVFSIYFFFLYLSRKDTLMTIGVSLFVIFFVFALRLTRMTFISVDHELSEGMIYFTYLWNFVLLNNICFCLIGIYFIYDRWYFLFPYNFVYFVVALLSYLFALDLKNDFGKGLNEAMEGHSIELDQQPQLSKVQSNSNNITEENMIINTNNNVNDVESAINNS